jgi:hypothetical protein
MTSKCYLLTAASLVLACVLAVLPAPGGAAETVLDDIAVLRATLKADRTVVVAEAMQLTEEEGKAFWPLYREYRAVMDTVHDGLVKLVLEYADIYPNVPEDQARQMLKDYNALETKRLDTRVAYLKRFAKTITSAKALRLAQVENRLDLGLRLQLAGVIPLVPAQAK